jgi:hypothetical protein
VDRGDGDEGGHIMDSCAKHPHKRGSAICQRCGETWCAECLVYAFGAKKPPYCVGCAMFAGGVRSAATRPAMAKRELKARLKAAKVAAKAASRDRAGVEGDSVPPEAVPAGPLTDWETPWWEDGPALDREPTLTD